MLAHADDGARVGQKLAADGGLVADQDQVHVFVFHEVLHGLVKIAVTRGEIQRRPAALVERTHQVKREPDIDGLLLHELEVPMGFRMEHRAATPARRPKERLFLQPIQFDAETRARRWWIGERTVKRVGFARRWVLIGVEIIGLADALAEGGFQILAQLQVVQAIGALEALPRLEQVGTIDEPSSVRGQSETPPPLVTWRLCREVALKCPGGASA